VWWGKKSNLKVSNAGDNCICWFFEVSSPKKGEYVFISAAAGAFGQLVG